MLLGPLRDEAGRVVHDESGAMVPTVVARDAQSRVNRDETGRPWWSPRAWTNKGVCCATRKVVPWRPGS